MNIENLKFKIARYKFESIRLSVPEFDPFDVPFSQVLDMMIEKDFNEYFFPYFTITICIPSYLYRGMKAHPYENKLTIDLQIGEFPNIEISNNDTIVFTPYIKGEFLCYITDATPELDQEKQDLVSKEAGVYKEGYAFSDIASVTLLLYNEKMILGANKVVNYILTSATLTDAIVFTCNQAGIDKLFLSPPQNAKAYKELCITPIPASNQIERLCNEYGLHKKGSVVFFDFDELLIIDKDPKCTVYKKNEYKITYLAYFRLKRQDARYSSGCYKDSKEKYNMINIVPDSITLDDQSKIQKSNVMQIDAKTGSVKTVTGENSSGSVSRVFVTNNGDDTSEAYKYAVEETKWILHVGMECINLEFLNPNKEFIFTTDDVALAKYNGSYRIVKYICKFEKEGIYWKGKVTGEFRR